VPVGAAAARAEVNFSRTDIPLAGADSVAIGDLDGVRGPDLAIAMSQTGSVGVMLNNGDGTLGALTPYSAGPPCAGLAVDVTLGDVVLPPDGKLDAYVACSPYVVRLTGDGAGGFNSPTPFNLGVAPYNGTTDMLALVRRSGVGAAPQLAFQHQPGGFGSQVCISPDLDGEHLVCDSTPAGGPLAVGDLNGAFPGVPPDEIVTGEGGDKLGIFGFAHQPVLDFSESSRIVPGGVESATLGDLDGDSDNDVLVGQYVNSLSDRVPSIHLLMWGAGGLATVATPLPSTAGLDDLAIADVDGDGCNDVVAAGAYGRGMVHLGDGAGGFDGGRDLLQIAYQNPSSSTRVMLAVGDLSGDGRPELVIVDRGHQALMLYRNASTPAGAACFDAPPVARDDAAVVTEDASATVIDVLANDTDPDGGPLAIASVTQPAHGSAAPAGSGVTYRPAADYCNDLGGAPDTFTYSLNGGSTATVSVTVQCVDDTPPVIVAPAVVPTVVPVPAPPPGPALPRSCDNPGTVRFGFATSGDDVLVGTSGRDTLSGNAGEDCVFGLAADDLLNGGSGADLLDGAAGDDRLNGGAGDDVLVGGNGSDVMNGAAGNDKLNAGNGNDELTPSAGKDIVNGQGGNDTIRARDGAKDTIDCGAGRDKVVADRQDSVRNCERRTFN
jgi:Ca2+-binding RTX toxin-like protein